MEETYFHLVFREVIEEYGYSIIADRHVVNYLSDMGGFKDIPSLRYILATAVNEGYCEEILKYHKSGKKDTALLDKYVELLYHKYGYDAQLIKYLFKSIAFALHWIDDFMESSLRIMTRGGFVYPNKFFAGGLILHKVLVSEKETILEMSESNVATEGDFFYDWITIEPDAHLEANGKIYKLIEAENIKISPEKTFFDFTFQRIHFNLHFEPISNDVKSFDFIESPNGSWNMYDVKLCKRDHYILYDISKKTNPHLMV